MRNPRENLGDYGTIIDDLHLYDGDKQKMYDDIRKSGADDAAFKHRLEGGFIFLAAAAAVKGGIRLWNNHRRKKQEAKEAKEAELKARYNAMVASDTSENDPDDESVENERDVADTE